MTAEEFIESLPEAGGDFRRHAEFSAAHVRDLEDILIELCYGLSKATGTASINIAAGVALNRLTGKIE